jgi:hypothetical protein
LAKSETHEITREVLKEFVAESFGGKTSKEYHGEIVKEILSRNSLLSSIKGNFGLIAVKEIELIIAG